MFGNAKEWFSVFLPSKQTKPCFVWKSALLILRASDTIRSNESGWKRVGAMSPNLLLHPHRWILVQAHPCCLKPGLNRKSFTAADKKKKTHVGKGSFGRGLRSVVSERIKTKTVDDKVLGMSGFFFFYSNLPPIGGQNRMMQSSEESASYDRTWYRRAR